MSVILPCLKVVGISKNFHSVSASLFLVRVFIVVKSRSSDRPVPLFMSDANMQGLKSCCRQWAFIILLTLTIQGCAGHSPEATAVAISDRAQLHMAEIKGGEFILRVYYRFDSIGSPLHIYLEGDGRAWLSKSRASRNPSPKNPVGLTLAAQQHKGNVMYIARPCQYVSFEKNPKCEYPYWTSKRFASEVIDSVSAVIDIGRKRSGAEKLEIIGYSGGGAVAILVAARRSDVSGIRTVAGNLDHRVWTQHHKVDPLRGSLNAADVAEKVAHIPQVHYVGSQDENIGRYIAESFRTKAGRDNCIKINMVKVASHSKGWEQAWPGLFNVPIPDCR